MLFSSRFILYFLGLALTSLTDAKYGEPCENSYKCGKSVTYGRSFEECVNGRCNCSDSSYFQFSNSGASMCEENYHTLKMCYEREYGSDLGLNRQCPTGQECIDLKCFCTTGLFRIGDKCLSRTFVGPMGRCRVDFNANLINTCDNIANDTFCHSGKCHCFRSYFYNFTSSTCQPKKNYTAFHKIDEYKALPRGYCLDSSDCVEGLNCESDSTCACPSECAYKEEKLMCDCGQVDMEVPISVLITGIILGLVFFMCWCVIIEQTVKRHNKITGELGMREMTSRDEDRSSSDVEHTLNLLPPEESPKQIPITDNPPPYSSVPYPLQPPSDPIAVDPASYPVTNSPGYSPCPSKGSSPPPPYLLSPSAPMATDQSDLPPKSVPYPLDPPTQVSDPNAQIIPCPTTDPRSSSLGYPTDLQPSAPVGFDSGTPQPDLSFQASSTMQPAPPSYPLDPKHL